MFDICLSFLLQSFGHRKGLDFLSNFHRKLSPLNHGKFNYVVLFEKTKTQKNTKHHKQTPTTQTIPEKKNLNINCISPGFIKTTMTDKIDQKFKETIVAKIPSGRLGEPEDIANAVLFLASNLSNYVNGETLHVNGGMYMA